MNGGAVIEMLATVGHQEGGCTRTEMWEMFVCQVAVKIQSWYLVILSFIVLFDIL